MRVASYFKSADEWGDTRKAVNVEWRIPKPVSRPRCSTVNTLRGQPRVYKRFFRARKMRLESLGYVGRSVTTRGLVRLIEVGIDSFQGSYGLPEPSRYFAPRSSESAYQAGNEWCPCWYRIRSGRRRIPEPRHPDRTSNERRPPRSRRGTARSSGRRGYRN